MMKCVVYWLFDETCRYPARHGYVGITTRFKRRIVEHRLSGEFPDGFSAVIIYEGTVDECFAIEEQLRPQHRIGWNKSRGGHMRNHSVGYAYSDEARAKMSAALKGREISSEWREKLRLAGIGHKRSVESRSKQSASMAGRSKTPEQRAKMSAAALARYADPKERELARQYQVGKHDHRGEKNPRFGKPLSDEAKRNISEGRKGKGLGNQNWRKRAFQLQPSKEG